MCRVFTERSATLKVEYLDFSAGASLVLRDLITWQHPEPRRPSACPAPALPLPPWPMVFLSGPVSLTQPMLLCFSKTHPEWVANALSQK